MGQTRAVSAWARVPTLGSDGARGGGTALAGLRPGSSFGVGSLPHRSAREAATFAMTEYDVPTAPSLPRRSPAEGMIAQAVIGISGVSLGPYGSIAVDRGAIDPEAPVVTDLAGPAFRGMRAFGHAVTSAGYRGPVKWQFAGPVTLGVALARAGLDSDVAFTVASHAVRAHVAALSAALSEVLTHNAQIVVIDEPWFGELMDPGFPVAPDRVIDMVSGAMAAVSGVATVGVHCCAPGDVASLLAAGPDLVSIPVRRSFGVVAGYVSRFVAAGGHIAWGVVPTDGPVFTSPERHWRLLSEVWRDLELRGVDIDQLRAQSLVSPQCGLGKHTPAVAERVCRAAREVGRRIRETAGTPA